MKKIAIVCAAAIACVPAIYGLGHVKGKAMCNAPNIIHAVRDVSQSFLMNAPLIEGVYKAGVRVSIEANCLKHQQDALQYTGQGRELLGLGASPTL